MDRIIHVVDARQVAARTGGVDAEYAEYVAFGRVLVGMTIGLFNTRPDGTVNLMDPLDFAVACARTEVSEKRSRLDRAALNRVAELFGIGAVKYADLVTPSLRNYAFDRQRMFAGYGKTACHLQFANARICSILRRGNVDGTVEVNPDVAVHSGERAMLLALDGFGDTLTEVGHTLEPHRLCGYLVSTAMAFSEFYRACPIIAAETPEMRTNRLALCQLTSRTLSCGLDLLGIAAPDWL
jgi:arginyl-tRNA synthetase